MNRDIHDELDRLFADERLELRPRPGTVVSVLRGARRRRTRRIVATTAGSIAAGAAAMAIAFTAVGFGPAADRLAPAAPSIAEGERRAAMEEAEKAVHEAAIARDKAHREAEAEAEALEPNPRDLLPGVPVLDPVEGIDGIRLGMTLDELREVPGVEFSDNGRSELCHGTFSTDRVEGAISVLGGGEPARSEDDFVVTAIWGGDVQTPEGVGPGVTMAEVAEVYPSAEGSEVVPLPLVSIDVPSGRSASTQWKFNVVRFEHTVESVILEAGQACFG